MNSDEVEESHEQGKYQEGPIQHKSVIRLAVLDVFANFCVTVGFSIVGSGVKVNFECALFLLVVNLMFPSIDVSSYI